MLLKPSVFNLRQVESYKVEFLKAFFDFTRSFEGLRIFGSL